MPELVIPDPPPAHRVRRVRVLRHLPVVEARYRPAPPASPPWLGTFRWPFPTWAVRRRPFDWAEDEADVPVPSPPPAWSVPDRQQADIYLRPAAPVVQR